MMKKFRPYQPGQQYLLPPDPGEWLPEDHPARFIDEMVNELDLSAIYNDYKEVKGKPPYSPEMMVKVLIYALSKGIHSSRRIERACYEDVALRYLSGNQQPDHWTICAFRRRHQKALGDLLVQTVRIAGEAGQLPMQHLSLDSTVVKANASKHSAMSYGRMEKEEQRLRREMERHLEQMEETDQAEDQEYGDRSGYELPPELDTAAKRHKAIKEAMANLEGEAKQKAKKERKQRQKEAKARGKTYRPRQKISEVKPKPKDQWNFTDPESGVMRNSDKAFVQGYNAQATVDAEAHIIVAADVSNRAGDAPHLKPQLEQVRENTGNDPEEFSADAGYYSQENLDHLEENHIEAFIPPDKIKHTEWREQQSPKGRLPLNINQRDLMRRKLRTKRGRRRYKLRQTSVEPAFGYIKEQLGLRQFPVRGLKQVKNYWRFACAVFNFMRFFRVGIRPKGVPLAVS